MNILMDIIILIRKIVFLLEFEFDFFFVGLGECFFRNLFRVFFWYLLFGNILNFLDFFFVLFDWEWFMFFIILVININNI